MNKLASGIYRLGCKVLCPQGSKSKGTCALTCPDFMTGKKGRGPRQGRGLTGRGLTGRGLKGRGDSLRSEAEI